LPIVNITDLSLQQTISGLGSLIFVIFSIIIGVKIFKNYFIVKKNMRMKRKEFISVGLTWVFLSSAWWGGAFCFLSIFLFQYAFEIPLYIFLGITFIPFALIFWLYSFFHLYLKDRLGLKKNLSLHILITCCLIYWIFLIILLFYDYTLVGTYTLFQTRPALLPLVFEIIAILLAVITGCIFASQSMKSSDKRIAWKGRFLLFGFLLFTIGAFLEVLISLNPIGLILVRLILIASAFNYYLGFLLPKFIEKRLIKIDS